MLLPIYLFKTADLSTENWKGTFISLSHPQQLSQGHQAGLMLQRLKSCCSVSSWPQCSASLSFVRSLPMVCSISPVLLVSGCALERCSWAPGPRKRLCSVLLGPEQHRHKPFTVMPCWVAAFWHRIYLDSAWSVRISS